MVSSQPPRQKGNKYTQPKNAQVATNLLPSCNNLLQQADIRMRSHGLRQLVDKKSVASCQQACCKLVILTGLLQVVSTSCNKSANDKLQQD